MTDRIRDTRKGMTIARKPACGGCVHDPEPRARASTTNTKARTYKFMLVDHWLPTFAFRGMTNVQTRDIMRLAMRDLSLICGAKFIEDAAAPHLRIKMVDHAYGDAIGSHEGNGIIHMSRTRSISARNARICVMHEVLHFLGIKANPAADGWGHCVDKLCVLHSNGTGPEVCVKCRGLMLARFGPLDVRGAGTPTTDAPNVGGPQPAQPKGEGT